MEEVKKMSIKDLALAELAIEQTEDAKAALKVLYRKLVSAEKVCKNIQREIDDYLMKLEG